ncbi:MAG: 2-oxoacid:acceptor oxidoreductase family protein [Candidatus Rokubacteria bacterium]|nr:2-oxoacid:acceptor oxidoreductase family protein [Candidatus Rokubacteria bacterium]
MADLAHDPCRLILVGVGGQGTLTLAQMIMEVARRSGYQALQSEIHGMSQRGGTVYAYLSLSRDAILTPAAMEASSHLLIALEPLEALRYLPFLRSDALLFVSREPVRTLPDYPDEGKLLAALEAVPGVRLVDTVALAERLRFKQAGGMALLGLAARCLPFGDEVWRRVIAERFGPGTPVTEKNLQAFAHGLG